MTDQADTSEDGADTVPVFRLNIPFNTLVGLGKKALPDGRQVPAFLFQREEEGRQVTTSVVIMPRDGRPMDTCLVDICFEDDPNNPSCDLPLASHFDPDERPSEGAITFEYPDANQDRSVAWAIWCAGLLETFLGIEGVETPKRYARVVDGNDDITVYLYHE